MKHLDLGPLFLIIQNLCWTDCTKFRCTCQFSNWSPPWCSSQNLLFAIYWILNIIKKIKICFDNLWFMYSSRWTVRFPCEIKSGVVGGSKELKCWNLGILVLFTNFQNIIVFFFKFFFRCVANFDSFRILESNNWMYENKRVSSREKKKELSWDFNVEQIIDSRLL